MLDMMLSSEFEQAGAALQHVNWQQASANVLDERLDGAPVRQFAAREHVCYEGDRKFHVYKVEIGAVCLYKTTPDGRRQIVDFAYPGDYVGLGALDTHVFSAQAISPTRLKCLAVAALRQRAERDPRLGLKLYEAVSHELQAARDLLVTVGQRNATGRVAAFLLALSRRNERDGHDPGTFVLPMTRSDIADFLSLTIETVSRTFSKLKLQGLIDLPHSAVVEILDAKALEELASGDKGGRI